MKVALMTQRELDIRSFDEYVGLAHLDGPYTLCICQVLRQRRQRDLYVYPHVIDVEIAVPAERHSGPLNTSGDKLCANLGELSQHQFTRQRVSTMLNHGKCLTTKLTGALARHG
jgi:hypothetical protein